MNFLLIFLMIFDKTSITVTSTAFKDMADIPVKYSCEGQSVSPPLSIGQVPNGTKSLALIVSDPDADKGIVTHWVSWNIPASTTFIAEGSAPGVQGKNEKGENKYMGPCPPTGSHHYYFKVYALDKMLDIKSSSTRQQVEDAINGHILAEGQIVGMYQKKK